MFGFSRFFFFLEIGRIITDMAGVKVGGAIDGTKGKRIWGK